MKRIIILVVSFLIITFTLNLYSQQTTKLLYHKKVVVGKDKHINIFLSTSNGNKNVKSEDITDSDYLYFCYNPTGNWSFKENEIYGDKYLNNIYIQQNGNNIKNIRLIPKIEGNKIIKVIAYFPKEQISMIKSF